MGDGSREALEPLRRPPRAVRDRIQQLSGVKEELEVFHAEVKTEMEECLKQLAIAEGVSQALDDLSQEIFGNTVHLLEEKLTIALQEVLEQPIALKVECRYLRGAAAIEFHVERDGHTEHIMRGQGGSVANTLSVGLRMFALTTLDPERHRRFLVMDEQDCWLHPDLVPRLVKIVREAGQALGFQVLMISHHDWRTFERHADRIYRLEPHPNGVKVHEHAIDNPGRH